MVLRRAGSPASALLRLLALLLALTLVAAACGGDDDDDGAAPGGDDDSDEEPVDEGEPVPGGKLVIGVEAETDGFDPTVNRWAVSGLSYANAVFDPLVAQNEDGEFVPYLAETIEPNDDYTVWTMKLRDGIKFHNGDPLTSDAIVIMFEAHLASALTSPAIRNLESVTKVDDLTVTFNMKRPWVVWPAYLTGQLGMVAAPAQLADKENGSRNPIGTGPFKFKEWIPGQRLVLTKNAEYWRASEGLPYLDEVEFRPIIEEQTRVSALRSGEVDVLHTSDSEAVQALRDAGDAVRVRELTEGATEENFLLINTAVKPFDKLVCRTAIARALDRQLVIDTIDRGLLETANGPFSGQDEFTQPDWIEYDVEQATADAEQCAEEQGTDKLSFEYGTTDEARSRQTAELLQDLWSQAGIEVSIKQTEQSQFILNAVLGDFQVHGWRQHGAPDPDQDFVWWDIENAGDIGSLSLNFGRYKNPALQEILLEARETDDEATRHDLYDQVSQIFAEEVPFIYISRTLWVYGAKPGVGGYGAGFPMPGGGGGGADPLAGVIRAGALFRTE